MAVMANLAHHVLNRPRQCPPHWPMAADARSRVALGGSSSNGKMRPAIVPECETHRARSIKLLAHAHQPIEIALWKLALVHKGALHGYPGNRPAICRPDRRSQSGQHSVELAHLLGGIGRRGNLVRAEDGARHQIEAEDEKRWHPAIEVFHHASVALGEQPDPMVEHRRVAGPFDLQNHFHEMIGFGEVSVCLVHRAKRRDDVRGRRPHSDAGRNVGLQLDADVQIVRYR